MCEKAEKRPRWRSDVLRSHPVLSTFSMFWSHCSLTLYTLFASSVKRSANTPPLPSPAAAAQSAAAAKASVTLASRLAAVPPVCMCVWEQEGWMERLVRYRERVRAYVCVGLPKRGRERARVCARVKEHKENVTHRTVCMCVCVPVYVGEEMVLGQRQPARAAEGVAHSGAANRCVLQGAFPYEHPHTNHTHGPTHAPEHVTAATAPRPHLTPATAQPPVAATEHCSSRVAAALSHDRPSCVCVCVCVC